MSENHKDHVFETLKDQQIFEERRILFPHANIKVMSSMMYDMLNYQGGFEFMESVYPRMIQTLHDFRSNSQMIVTKSRSRKRKKTTSEW